MFHGTRFYVSIQTRNHNHVMNFSQIDKPTIYELRAFVMATLDLTKVKLVWSTAGCGPFVDGFDCQNRTYAIFSGGKQLDVWLDISERPNDVAYTAEFGAMAPAETEAETEAYYERWNALAPKRCFE